MGLALCSMDLLTAFRNRMSVQNLSALTSEARTFLRNRKADAPKLRGFCSFAAIASQAKDSTSHLTLMPSGVPVITIARSLPKHCAIERNSGSYDRISASFGTEIDS
jgi:hypothetical protein